jgi:hypothetical protein
VKTKWMTGMAGIVAEILYALLYVLAGLAIAFFFVIVRR